MGLARININMRKLYTTFEYHTVFKAVNCWDERIVNHLLTNSLINISTNSNFHQKTKKNYRHRLSVDIKKKPMDNYSIKADCEGIRTQQPPSCVQNDNPLIFLNANHNLAI